MPCSPTHGPTWLIAGPKFEHPDSLPKMGAQGSDVDHTHRLSLLSPSSGFGREADFGGPPVRSPEIGSGPSTSQLRGQSRSRKIGESPNRLHL